MKEHEDVRQSSLIKASGPHSHLITHIWHSPEILSNSSALSQGSEDYTAKLIASYFKMVINAAVSLNHAGNCGMENFKVFMRSETILGC